MLSFIKQQWLMFFKNDIPAVKNWIIYGKLQAVMEHDHMLPDLDVKPEVQEDDAIHDEPEELNEVDSAETYIDDDDFKGMSMEDWLNRSKQERKYINELLTIHGVDARVNKHVYGGHTFYAFPIDTENRHSNSIEKWSNVERIVPEIEAILHKRRLEGGAIDEGIDRGLIRPDYRTVIRVTDQPQMLEVSRIDVRDLLFNIEEYEGDPHTAFAGIGYANGRAINIVWDLDDPDTAHLMIAGRTGSGKSVLLASVVATLAHSTPPDELDLYLVDGKNDDLAPFVALPHVRSFSHEPEDNIRVIEYVASVVDERNENDDRKRVVLVIDELADVVATGDSDAAITALTKIAQKGRSKNVHLIGCTQKPKASNMGGDVKSNIPLKYIGAVGSPEDAKLISGLKQTGAEKLPGRGSFLCIRGGGITRFQAPFIEDVELAIELICNTWGYEIVDEPEEADATADITMQKLSNVFSEFYVGMNDEGKPTLGRGGMKAAIAAINDGIVPTGGRKRKELTGLVNEYLDQWFQDSSISLPEAFQHDEVTLPQSSAEEMADESGTRSGRVWEEWSEE